MELTLKTPVQYVPRVGPVRAKLLDKLGVQTVEDLLYYIPFRYNDFSIVSPIAKVQPGETVTVTGEIVSIKTFITKTGKRIQEAKVTDVTGTLTVIWFNQPYLIKILKPDDIVNLSGQIAWFGNKIVMSSPVYELSNIEGSDTSMPENGRMRSFQTYKSLHTGRLVPVYSETEGITSKWLRGRVDFVLTNVLALVTEFLPDDIIISHKLMRLSDAFSNIHFPKNKEAANQARRRLAFDELFLLQMKSQLARYERELSKNAFTLSLPAKKIADFESSLPFTLTADQKKAQSEILSDLTKKTPMNRLLEGDVGSGKTVVATIAMYATFTNGFGSLLMAPTQILAEQHYQTVSKLLRPFNIPVSLVTSERSMKYESGIMNKNVREFSSHNSLFNIHNSSIIVGTHALLFQNFSLEKIGLVVIDEQQRFGVFQRAKLLTKKGSRQSPHLLTMTATPIPRTVAKIVLGNIDVSVLHELPKGRQKVKTWVVPNHKREGAYEWIKKQIQTSAGQAFVVCPLIEESETLTTVRAVTSEYARLKKIFAPFSVALLHGRMTAREKTTVLDGFRNKKSHILVTTPVVEVGIDIPNATIMMIEAAERFGLAGLHQLRGRVGRGTLPSYCLLFTEQDDELTIKRLKALETTYNGPELAEIDLKLRGPGEIFGKRQHGEILLRIADFNDTDLLEETRTAASTIVETDPTLSSFPLLSQKLKVGTIQSAVAD